MNQPDYIAHLYEQIAKFMEDAQRIIDANKEHVKDIDELNRIMDLESPK